VSKPELATVLIVPGLRDHVAEHWQTLLATKLAPTRAVHTVPPLEHDKLSCAARVQAIQHALEQIDGPVILVAHSGGVIMLAHWAQQYQRANIVGALLAAPADLETPLPVGYPTWDALSDNGWLPIPRTALPFRSIVAASSNDPLAALARVEELAHDWGSECVPVGAVGHLNPASGFGEWPRAEEFIYEIDRSIKTSSEK
jgi:predicted alpha/beta hydrolase family esterase